MGKRNNYHISHQCCWLGSGLLVLVSCGTTCGRVSCAVHTEIHCTHLVLLGLLGLPALQACPQTRFSLCFELSSWGMRRGGADGLPLLSPVSFRGTQPCFDHACKFRSWTDAKIGAAFLKIWPLIACSAENEETLTFLSGIQPTDLDVQLSKFPL